MKLLPTTWRAACGAVLALMLVAGPAAAAQRQAHGGKAAVTAQAGKSAKSAGKVAGKAPAKTGAATRRGKAKARGPTVITVPSPPAAQLEPLQPTAVRTGCVGGAPEPQLNYTPEQVVSWMGPPAAEGANCRRFVALAFAAPAGQQASLALLSGGGTRALLVAQQGVAAEPETRWVEVDPEVRGLHELWLPAAPTPAHLEEVPPALQNELVLLAAAMKQRSGAPDTAMLRVWLQDDGEDSQLQALELVDPLSGRALESAVWLARPDEPGAYISSSGVEYERMLWQSPVRQLRISRGIGASSMVVNKRTVVKTRSKGKTRSKIVVRAFRYQGQHVGIDFAAPTGTPVVAVADGEIAFAGWRGGYGQLVLIQHGDDFSTYYGHLSAFGTGIEAGTRVRRGQVIGLVGSTGFSTGPHLHYEIRKAERYVDPTRPDVHLPFWMLRPDEHPMLMARLLQLELTRAAALSGRPQPTS